MRAGHPEPEFYETDGAVWVRFFPKRPIGVPVVSDTALSERQREILRVQVRAVGAVPFAQVMAEMSSPPSERTVRNELIRLRDLGYVATEGHGRGAPRAGD